MKIGIIVGPGHHHHLMMNALKRRKIPFRYALYWPSLQVFQVESDGKEVLIYQSQFYNVMATILWAIWVRLPLKKKKRFHRDWLFTLYDRLITRFFQNCDLVVGWPQVSLHTIKRVKQNGGKFILEHPMVHADYWNSLLIREYRNSEVQKGDNRGVHTNYMIQRMRKEYQLADKINLLSTYAKQTFTDSGVSKNKLLVTPLGISINSFTPAQKQERDEFIFLFVGRLELLKGVHYLLKAFSSLNLPSAKLWLVGAMHREIEPYLKKYEGSFEYLGEMKKDKLITIYQQSNVFVFPSLMDAYGLVILEAMACSVPVISSANSGGYDIIEDGNEGFIVPPYNVEVLKAKMEYLYMNPELAKSQGQKARQKVLKLFTEENYQQHIVNQLMIDQF